MNMSAKVDALTPGAEVFFNRLMMEADDYGNYYATAHVLRSKLFPLKEKYTSRMVSAWLSECLEIGLVAIYLVNADHYLHIFNFGQSLRRMKREFPDHPKELEPNKEAKNLTDIKRQNAEICGLPSIGSRREEEVEEEGNIEGKSAHVVVRSLKKIPEEEEFVLHCKELLQDRFPAYEFSLRSKYRTWVDDGWKDGFKKPIKNWKNKIANTLPYLKPTPNANTRTDKYAEAARNAASQFTRPPDGAQYLQDGGNS